MNVRVQIKSRSLERRLLSVDWVLDPANRQKALTSARSLILEVRSLLSGARAGEHDARGDVDSLREKITLLLNQHPLELMDILASEVDASVAGTNGKRVSAWHVVTDLDRQLQSISAAPTTVPPGIKANAPADIWS